MYLISETHRHRTQGLGTMSRLKSIRAVTAVELAIVGVLLILIAACGLVFLYIIKQNTYHRYTPTPTATAKLSPPSVMTTYPQLSQIRTALEAYKIDWNAYPPPAMIIEATAVAEDATTASDTASKWTTTQRLVEPDPTAAMHQWPIALTTPVSYLSTVPKDIFSTGSADFRYRSYVFIDPGKTKHHLYVLAGCGPDADRDFPLDEFLPLPDSLANPNWSSVRRYNLPKVLPLYGYDPAKPGPADGDVILFAYPGGNWPP
jgi:hypothetical protein